MNLKDVLELDTLGKQSLSVSDISSLCSEDLIKIVISNKLTELPHDVVKYLGGVVRIETLREDYCEATKALKEIVD